MKISVITPSLNQGEFIEQTIQSVITQHCVGHEIEYMVMDGGSTDNTLAILKQYQHQIAWRSDVDNGQSHAINKGLQHTTGEIVAWLNSDDVYYPHAIKIVADYFESHPDVDVVYGDAHLLDREGGISNFYPTETFNLERLKARCFISQPATFIRRSAIVKFGLLDESLNFCMDYDYWLRLGMGGAKFVYLPTVLAGARIYPETKSAQYCQEAIREAIAMLKRILGYIPSEWLVSYSGANIRAKSGLRFPEPKFIFLVWLNLWKVSGCYYQGFNRVTVWVHSQQTMLTEFARRCVNALKKKVRRYS